MGGLKETIDAMTALASFGQEEVSTARRQRPVLQLRVNGSMVDLDESPEGIAELREALDGLDLVGPAREPSARPSPTPRPPRLPFGGAVLTDDLRASLWDIVVFFLFAPAAHDESDGASPWACSSPSGPPIVDRPAVQRVWTSPPISGDPARIPADLPKLLEGWFSLVEPGDVYAFIETVHDSLDAHQQIRFAGQCNGALERGLSDHRFVLSRLVPVASRTDIAVIERALAVARSFTTSGERESSAGVALENALARLAAKPESDGRGAIQEAIRAVELAALALTGERHLTLEDAMADLRRRGLIDDAAESAHRGLHAFATSGARDTTTDGARRVLVMCAGFVTHLAAHA